jgi:hypothetical protein
MRVTLQVARSALIDVEQGNAVIAPNHLIGVIAVPSIVSDMTWT